VKFGLSETLMSTDAQIYGISHLKRFAIVEGWVMGIGNFKEKGQEKK